MKAVRPTAQQGQIIDSRLESQATTLGGGYIRINIQVTEVQYEKMRRISYEEKLSQAEIVRQALEDWFAARKGEQ
jgi:hypothetical protein